MMITVYVPKSYLTETSTFNGELPKPSEFWLSRPDTWMTQDLATISVSAETWSKWNKITDNKVINGKQLLKG